VEYSVQDVIGLTADSKCLYIINHHFYSIKNATHFLAVSKIKRKTKAVTSYAS